MKINVDDTHLRHCMFNVFKKYSSASEAEMNIFAVFKNIVLTVI